MDFPANIDPRLLERTRPAHRKDEKIVNQDFFNSFDTNTDFGTLFDFCSSPHPSEKQPSQQQPSQPTSKSQGK